MLNPLTPLRNRYAGLSPAARQLAAIGAALLAGIVVVPWFVFLAGRSTLGAYGNGGPFSLWADFFRGLAEFTFAYWFAALGPLLVLILFLIWRKLTA